MAQSAAEASPDSEAARQAWLRAHAESRVPLGWAATALVAAGSAVGAAVSPGRADLVAALGETTGGVALRRMHRRMQADPEGAAILHERLRVTDATLAAAHASPPGTFGAEYAAFMGVRHFTPSERPPVRFIEDPELAYVAQRGREVHDFWHVLFGCGTTVLGELALKGVEFANTGLPMAALSVAGAAWRLPAAQRRLLKDVYLPWAARSGARAVDLMSVRYERMFADDLLAVRDRLRIMPAPQPELLGVKKPLPPL